MEQRAGIRFLTLKGLRASVIAAKLKSVCETEALALSVMKSDANALQKGEFCYPTIQEPKVWQTHYQRLIRILHDMVGMKIPFLLGSHALDTNQKVEKIILSRGIFSVLQGIRSTGFQSVITGNES
jgi:hypothetical protein